MAVEPKIYSVEIAERYLGDKCSFHLHAENMIEATAIIRDLISARFQKILAALHRPEYADQEPPEIVTHDNAHTITVRHLEFD